jgi:PadR family transcriptional regulator PadR
MSDPDDDLVSLDRWSVQLRKGTLGLAVLASLWDGRLYGLEILRRLEAIADLSVPEGTIYPLLNRLKRDGLVSSEWVEAEGGHPRKYFTLTEAGRRRAADMAQAWGRFAAGLDAMLTPMRQEQNR